MPEEKQYPFLSLVILYGIFVSLLYLYGYWSTFEINILHYVSLSDVIKLAIYPIIIGIAISYSMLIVTAIIGGHFIESLPTIAPTPMSPIIRKIFIVINFVIIFAGNVLGEVLGRDKGMTWFVSGMLMVPIVSWYITDIPIVVKYIPNVIIRRFATYIILSILFVSLGWGRMDADKIVNGHNIIMVSTNIFKGKGTKEFDAKGLLATYANLKYLGATGDYFFFLTPNNADTIIVKYEDLHFIELQRKK